MDCTIEMIFGKEASVEIELGVDFKVTADGCPAHMGSLSYAGHPAEPAEIEIEAIWWPTKRFDTEKRVWVDDHFEFPLNALPEAIHEAIYAHIIENYDPDD